MKILAEGDMRDRVDEALGNALALDCFPIGPANRQVVGRLDEAHSGSFKSGEGRIRNPRSKSLQKLSEGRKLKGLC